jgi:glycosyltransferase involved in cell wall biosynthesis
MTVSVVMATYNGAEFIEEQLDTIREQTRLVDELIICDDGSSDKTVDVVRAYITRHGLEDKWHIYENPVNLGYANNFNHSASLATGDLLFFSDQDDRWDSEKIRTMERIMQEHEDCTVLCTDYFPWIFGDGAAKAPKSVVDKMPDNGVLEKIKLSNRSLYIGAIGCCMCVRRDFFKKIEQYWFDGWAQDDRMWRLAQCVDGLYVLHSNLVWHRIHANNTSTYGNYHGRAKRAAHFREMLLACEQSEKAAEELNRPAGDKKILSSHTYMMKRRCEMLENRKPLCALGLIKYLKYYQNYRSFLVDLYCLR